MQDNSADQKLQRAVHALLQDPLTIREVDRMRQQGRSEEYIQRWLMQIASLQA